MESEQPFLAGKKIIIVGAGIAGLAFVISLRKTWPTSVPFPEIVIYERDTNEAALGREGYSISIRGDAYSGGMQALDKMGILGTASAASVSGVASNDPGGAFSMWDTQWNRIVDFGSEPGIRITRSSLKQLMLDAALGIEGVQIRWATPCDNVTVTDGRVTMLLPNGETDEADLLLAADGASSKTRASLRPNDSLSYAGVVVIIGTSRFPSGQVPAPVDRDWGLVLGGNGTGLFVSPRDSSHATWSISYLSDEPRERTKRPYSEEEANALLQEASDRGSQFSEPFRSLVQNTDTSTLMVLNAMDKQPFPQAESQSPVVFIGDSNHAVSPFAGNGANMALLDGWDLAVQLSEPQPLSAALEQFDKSSIPRSQSALSMSHWSISMAHATGLKLLTYKVFMKLIGVLSHLKG